MPQLPQQFLGKRKGRSDEELGDDSPSRINPLTPVSDDSGPSSTEKSRGSEGQKRPWTCYTG